jgi:two-component system cell cycle sensor histidine kinase/response regulator CckA
VNVYSEPGRGTSFKVYLPRVQTEGPTAALPLAPRSRSGTETILVVEDSEGLRELTKRLLEKQDYTVLVAASADEAFEAFDRNGASIDLLLTDVVMPGISGPELSQRVVGRWPALKVIFMSGYTAATIVSDGVLNPGIAFLHKPFTAETLGRKVREVLDVVPAPPVAILPRWEHRVYRIV